MVALAAAIALSTHTAVLTAVGDIRLDGPIGQISARHGEQAPLKGVADLLKGDLLIGNLECPITERGTKFPKTWNFRAKPKTLRILKRAGFDVVNLSNNHVYDYGMDGLVDTLKHLKKVGITIVGAGTNRAEAEAMRVY